MEQTHLLGEMGIRDVQTMPSTGEETVGTLDTKHEAGTLYEPSSAEF